MKTILGAILVAAMMSGCESEVGQGPETDAGTDAEICCTCDGPVALLGGGDVECISGHYLCDVCPTVRTADR